MIQLIQSLNTLPNVVLWGDPTGATLAVVNLASAKHTVRSLVPKEEAEQVNARISEPPAQHFRWNVYFDGKALQVGLLPIHNAPGGKA